MSQPSRPRTRGPAERRRRDFQFERITPLEPRALLAPFVVTTPLTATLIPAATPTNANLGTISITPATTATTGTTGFPTQEPVTTVNELTPASSFGGDIVRIKAGPGGDFGSGVYAISRGAGENVGAVNRPGVIYRVDPATGQTSVFFDLNTVVNQLNPPSTDASNSVGTSTGLVNWYDIAFDPEGNFDGKPSMFVASVDRSDPNKNVIYRIGPDGSFMGAFVQFTAGQSSVKFNVNPTSILVPPPQDQSFLSGLIAGSGISSTGGQFSALLFTSTGYSPGQNIATSALPAGVTQLTGLSLGPQVGLTAANSDYISPVYSAFTDFGVPAGPTSPAIPGVSGVQGSTLGELLIAPPATTTTTTALTLDQTPAVTTPFRRFEDIAFDQYGYFSQGLPLTTTTTGTVATASVGSPVSAGNLFVADLASGLQVPVPTVAVPAAPPAPAIPSQTINVPAQFDGGQVSVTFNGTTPVATVTGGANIGGRILRITPQGVVTVFAAGFDTSGAPDSSSFIDSSLSISFSADGTTLYASDDQGIWQFKTTASLADSTSGSLIGLNDLRTLGVPYDGQDAAVAVIDSGVDAFSPPFRGRVANGVNIATGGLGNQDTSPAGLTTTTGTGTTTGVNTVVATSNDGHGTLVAGVVAQFVPQSTIEPVDVFDPFLASSGPTGTTGTTTGVTLSASTNNVTTTNNVYNGIKYVADHPFVNDPVRLNKADRVIAATFGFGSTTTWDSEGAAYRQFPQVVATLKNQLKRYRGLGIAPIAAAGQFGSPLAAGSSTTTGTTTGTTGGVNGANNAGNPNVGDSNGMSLPAILNEAISVTGVIPFPYTGTVNSLPTDPPIGITPNPSQPVLIAAGQTGTTGTTTTSNSPLGQLLLGNTPEGTTSSTGGTTTPATGTFIGGIPQGLYSDRVLASANRSATTDFAAPALDIPTFRRRFSLAATTTTGTTTTSTDPNDHLTFTQGGTSLSAGIVTGSYALVSSALNYWQALNQNGFTTSAYLTQPVGKNALNFGPHAFKDLSAYNNPDGINAILAWTSVPVTDQNDGLSQSQPPYLFRSTHFRQIDRIDVGNAIAAIEGSEAIQYLLDHNDFPIIDSNNNGVITAQELQNFEDNATAMGLSEAGAMARLLGGTASTPTAAPTSFGEQPDQAGALQRRFNFFDYAADGQLNGSITIPELKMLAHTLLPLPDSAVITDRQRASANGNLLVPNETRNFKDLQHTLPRYQFVPKSALQKYRNVTPDQLTVDRLVRGVDTPLTQFPVWSLQDNSGVTSTNSSSSNSTSPQATTASSATTSAASSATTPTASSATTPAASSATTPASSSATTPTTSSSTTGAQANAAASTPSTASTGSTTQGATPAATSSTSANTSTSSTTSTTTNSQSSSLTNNSSSSSNATPILQPQQTTAQKIASALLGNNGNSNSTG